jgi:hypothetical protein
MSDFGQYASGILGNTGEEKETFSSYANQLLKAPAQEKTKSEPTQNVLTDTAQDVIQGTLRIPGAITGLADIPAGLMGFNRPFDRATDYIGEKTGIQPGKLADSIQAHNYSPERMASDVAVNKAWNSEDTGLDYAAGIAKAYAQNPRSLLGNVVGSLPSMYAGGMLGNASRAAGLVSKANVPFVGEGAVMAGQAMDSIDASVDPQKAAILSAATGLSGGLLARGGGKLSEKMGLVDPDVAIANGLSQTATKAPMSLGARTAGGFLAEGAMEELPQSLMEQGLQNYAEDKPLTEGMARAGVEGLLSGGLMGAGFNALPQSTPKIVEKPISDGPLGNAAAAGGITQTEISDAGTTNQEALIPEQNLGGSSGAVLPASNGLGEPNDAMPEPESLVDQTGAATTGNEAEPAIATQQAPSPVDFQPTHLADDGTPVAYREDDQGPYFETADGQQWDYTDTATPITQEVQNANSPTGSVAENNPPITGQDSGIGSDQRGFDTSLEPTDGRADDRGISGADGQLRGAESPSDVESGGTLSPSSIVNTQYLTDNGVTESDISRIDQALNNNPGLAQKPLGFIRSFLKDKYQGLDYSQVIQDVSTQQSPAPSLDAATAQPQPDAGLVSSQTGDVEPEAAARDKAFNDVYQLFTNLKDGFNKGAELAETEGNESLLKKVIKHAINQLSQITDKKAATRIADFLLEEGNINNELEWINHADIETAVNNLAERYAKQTPETQPVLPDTGANQTGNAPTVGAGQGQSAVSGQEEVGRWKAFPTEYKSGLTKKKVDSVLPFNIFGNKSHLIANSIGVMMENAAKSSRRVIDAFAGSGGYTHYLSEMGALPKGSILNEYDPMRTIAHKQIKENPDAVIKAAQGFEDYVSAKLNELERPIIGENKRLEAAKKIRQELTNWAREQLKAHAMPGQDFVAKGRNNEPIEMQDTPETAGMYYFLQNQSFRYKPIQSDANRNGEFIVHGFAFVDTDKKTGKVKKFVSGKRYLKDKDNIIRTASGRIKDVNVQRGDGWALIKNEAGDGDLATVDTSYLNKGSGLPPTVNYNKATEEDANPDVYVKKIADNLLPAWDRGAKLVVTNNWDDNVASTLESLGFNVFQTQRAGEQNELVAINFDPTTQQVYSRGGDLAGQLTRRVAGTTQRPGSVDANPNGQPGLAPRANSESGALHRSGGRGGVKLSTKPSLTALFNQLGKLKAAEKANKDVKALIDAHPKAELIRHVQNHWTDVLVQHEKNSDNPNGKVTIQC